MNEDTRLFASNNPIGRVWYFINLIVLAVIVYATRFIILNSVLPNVNQSFITVVKAILYTAYFIYSITFLMLLDRRLCSIFLTREDEKYRKVSGILSTYIYFIVLLLILFGVMIFRSMEIPQMFSIGLTICLGILAVFALIIGFIPEIADKKK